MKICNDNSKFYLSKESFIKFKFIKIVQDDDDDDLFKLHPTIHLRRRAKCIEAEEIMKSLSF